MWFIWDPFVLLRLGWQGSCVRGAKKEVRKIMFIARISSQAVCLGLGVWAVCKQGFPWAAGFGRLFADKAMLASSSGRGCFGPVGSGPTALDLKASVRVWCGSSCPEGWGLNKQIRINVFVQFSKLLRNKVFSLRVEIIFALKKEQVYNLTWTFGNKTSSAAFKSWNVYSVLFI